ncbi:MAG: putative LPS assembly protein LptD, partial [bacterium]|nr:putative LPS assembly protein LptD [bacterium]
MRRLLRVTYLLLLLTFFIHCSSVRQATSAADQTGLPAASENLPADSAVTNRDTSGPPPVEGIVSDTSLTADSLTAVSDSTAAGGPADSLQTSGQDSLAFMPPDSTALSGKQTLEAAVFYTAQDSMIFTANNMGYLYGEADIKYGEMGIKGEQITMDMDSSIISSTFGLDSLGKEFGYPVFSEGDTEYEMKKVRYNFETRKAFIHHVVTQQGEGNIVANEAKMNADNSFFMRNAKYTTCDNHEHPHFYLNLSKAKVRPEKDVVTGPAWLVVADVPLFPIVLPFAFFPFTKTYSSGIIMPSYGDEMTRGFYLQNGGYYFALSDYIDLSLTGEIYTKGSWGAGARSNYRKRYKYSGNLNIYYLNTVT